jgi:hypothetical protein
MEASAAKAAVKASAAEAAMEASAAEAAAEASTTAMETASPSGAQTRYGWGRRDRKTEGKDLAIDLKSDTCMIASPIREFEPEGPLER